jgi:hypothetical protein
MAEPVALCPELLGTRTSKHSAHLERYHYLQPDGKRLILRVHFLHDTGYILVGE